MHVTQIRLQCPNASKNYKPSLKKGRYEIEREPGQGGMATAWSGRLEALMSSEPQDLPVRYIGLEGLIRNKRASGRPKDLDDLLYLAGDE